VQRVRCVFLLGVSLLGAITIRPTYASADDVPRITKDELKSKLDDPNVVILDVIREEDWKLSERKIKGAVRESPEKWKSWAQKYGKDKTLVLYCS
jgi:rhodanese-related sulfurtransferase